MTRRELLEERYEDALFSLLMDEIAVSEGQKALEENERLNNDPTFQVPEHLNRRCEQTIRRAFAKRTARAVGRVSFKAVKKIAMVAGLAAVLFTGAFAASETVRVNTMNFVMERYGSYAEFGFNDQSAESDDEMSLTVGWLPEGYVLEEQESDFSGIRYKYQKSKEECISVSYIRTTGLGMRVNTENAEISEVEINGIMGTWIKTEKEQQLVLIPRDRDIMIDVVAEGLTEEEFIHVANELEFN